MKNRLVFAIAAVAAMATTASADVSQLAASAGVDAADYTVTELARMKRNADTGRDEQIAVVIAVPAGDEAARSQLVAAAGLTAAEAAGMTLTELATSKANREGRGDDVHPIVSGRSLDPGAAGWTQFAASAGIDADAARGMTIHEIYRVRIAKQSRDD